MGQRENILYSELGLSVASIINGLGQIDFTCAYGWKYVVKTLVYHIKLYFNIAVVQW